MGWHDWILPAASARVAAIARFGATAIVVLVVLAAAGTAPGAAPTVQNGSVNLVDKTWICNGPVDLSSVTVTFDQNVADTSATPGGHDAVHLASGCTGHIGRLTVVQYHGDAVKVGGGAHDIVVDGGSIRCYAHDIGKHQDGIQAMGGTNVRFNRMDVQCDSANNSAFFVNRGTKSPEYPTNVVCQGCFLQGGGITVRIGNSINSGVIDSAVVPGHISAVNIYQAGAQSPIYENNTVGTPGAGLAPALPPFVLKRVAIGALPTLPLHVARKGTTAVLATRVAVNRDSTLSVGVTPSISMLRLTRVGGVTTGVTHLRLTMRAPAGALPIVIRLPVSALHSNRLYKVSITAVDAGGHRSTLQIPFRA